MKRTHLVYGEEVTIEWEKSDLIEDHGSGCCYFLMLGAVNGETEYEAVGIYQGDDLQDIEDIQTI